MIIHCVVAVTHDFCCRKRGSFPAKEKMQQLFFMLTGLGHDCSWWRIDCLARENCRRETNEPRSDRIFTAAAWVHVCFVCAVENPAHTTVAHTGF